MLKKSITYTDYNENQRTEDFYFNLTKAELTMMDLSADGGLEQRIAKMVQQQKAPLIMKTFEEIILTAYGEKSDDGRRFVKSDELSQAFKETEAYSELFMELLTDDKAAAAFINGILPKDIAGKLADMSKELPETTPEV